MVKLNNIISLNLMKKDIKMKLLDYEVKKLKGSFDGCVVYMFNSDVSYDIVEEIREFASCESEGSYSEFDPSTLYTDIGEFEDEVSFDDIVKKIDVNEDNKKKFISFIIKNIVKKHKPFIFIDVEKKEITQLSNENAITKIVEKYGSKLNLYIREYEYEEDFE
jgi:hypothetical protein